MDYKLAAGHNMKLVIRTKISARSLPHIDAQTRPENLTISLPVFVPARETARLRISVAGYPKPDVIELGRAVKRRYPGAYADLGDAELGRAVKLRSPGRTSTSSMAASTMSTSSSLSRLRCGWPITCGWPRQTLRDGCEGSFHHIVASFGNLATQLSASVTQSSTKSSSTLLNRKDTTLSARLRKNSCPY